MKENRVSFTSVGTPEHDDVGLFDFLVTTRATAGTKDRGQTDHARGVSSAVAGVDIVRTDRHPHEFLRNEVDLVGGFRAAEHAQCVGTEGAPGVCESLCGAVERFFPGCWTQPTCLADERFGETGQR